MTKKKNVAMSFNHLSVGANDKHLLFDVSGFVERGGITAVMGPSASGKSVLLQALSGRIQDLPISGEVTISGTVVNPKSISNPVAYVPQDDSLIGELTAREVTTNTALFKLNKPRDEIDKEVSQLLSDLGLENVADGIIGTLIFRGLSGGQKKRVEISSELIASPTILLMDEPTSGLDSSIAFDVLNTVRNLVKKSEGKLSVVLSIHQPNSKILDLFDHLLLLDNGIPTFFGTIPDSLIYFNDLGKTCPPNVTPTDYFLQITDSNFSKISNVDYEDFWKASENYNQLQHLISNNEENGSMTPSSPIPALETMKSLVPFWKQVYILVYRDYVLAYRDPTLYYFQMAILLVFGFFNGAVFFKLPQEIDGNFNIFPGGILWLILMNGWVHVFKVYHISKNDKRTKHEIANNKYSPLAAFLADWIASATIGVIFFPIAPLAFGMMGLPNEALPFLILLFWITSQTSEAMLAFITKFSTNPTISMICCQMALVDLMIFGGGVYIPWKDCPRYWVWVQEISLFTQSSRAAIMEVLKHMTFVCSNLNGNLECVDPGTRDIYQCDSYNADQTKCFVKGREILFVTQEIGSDNSYWTYFGFLVLILVFFKLGNLFFFYCPWERISYVIKLVNEKPQEERMSELAIRYSESKSFKKDQATTNDKKEEDDVRISISAAMGNGEDFNANEPVSLTWTNLRVVLPKKKTILIDNVTGAVTSGRVLALMGPSGAGKTTLLNALARRAKYAKVTGEVLFAGRAMTPTDLTYVPQFDEVNKILTVNEHLQLVGAMTCVDVEQMKARINILLDVLGLVSKKDVQVKDLSGGEVKRVSIGIGLISAPYVLFLDEPTTGLDSTAAYSIVKYLVTVAKTTNVAVIMTIHQPSALVFEMLDDLMLLESGRTVYSGSISDAEKYFDSVGYSNSEKINPADYYLEIVQSPPKQSTAEKKVLWSDLFLQSAFFASFNKSLNDIKESKVSKPAAIQPSSFSRYILLCKHFMMYFIRERGFYINRLAALIMIGVFVGTLFLNLEPTTSNITLYAGCMFFSTVTCMLTAVSATALFAKDRFEAVDRISNGVYTPGVYVAAQLTVSAFYNWIISFIFICIFHWLTNLNPSGECFIYDIFINWSHLMLMESALLTILEVLKNDFLTCTLAMIFVASNMAFSGFFRRITDLPIWVRWICYVIPLKWSFDGFLWQIFINQTFEVSGSPGVYLTGEYILENVFDLKHVNSWGLFGALIGYVFLFRLNQFSLFSHQTGMLFPISTQAGNESHEGSVKDINEEDKENCDVAESEFKEIKVQLINDEKEQFPL